MAITVQEAKIGLFDYFTKETSLKLSDYNSHFLLVDDVDLNKEIVKLAPLELVDLKILSKIELDSETYFILNKSLEDYEQNISISCVTAKTIAQIINEFRESVNQEGYACDPMSVNDGDIQNLIKILLSDEESGFDEE